MKRDAKGRFASILTEADKTQIKKWIATIPRHRVVARIIDRWGVHQLTADRWIKNLTK